MFFCVLNLKILIKTKILTNEHTEIIIFITAFDTTQYSF